MGVGAAWRPEAAARAWPEATARSQKSIEVSFFISKNDTFYDFLFAGVQRRSKFTYFQIGDAICEKRRNSHQNGH